MALTQSDVDVRVLGDTPFWVVLPMSFSAEAGGNKIQRSVDLKPGIGIGCLTSGSDAKGHYSESTGLSGVSEGAWWGSHGPWGSWVGCLKEISAECMTELCSIDWNPINSMNMDEPLTLSKGLLVASGSVNVRIESILRWFKVAFWTPSKSSQ